MGVWCRYRDTHRRISRRWYSGGVWIGELRLTQSKRLQPNVWHQAFSCTNRWVCGPCDYGSEPTIQEPWVVPIPTSLLGHGKVTRAKGHPHGVLWLTRGPSHQLQGAEWWWQVHISWPGITSNPCQMMERAVGSLQRSMAGVDHDQLTVGNWQLQQLATRGLARWNSQQVTKVSDSLELSETQTLSCCPSMVSIQFIINHHA